MDKPSSSATSQKSIPRLVRIFSSSMRQIEKHLPEYLFVGLPVVIGKKIYGQLIHDNSWEGYLLGISNLYWPLLQFGYGNLVYRRFKTTE